MHDCKCGSEHDNDGSRQALLGHLTCTLNWLFIVVRHLNQGIVTLWVWPLPFCDGDHVFLPAYMPQNRIPMFFSSFKHRALVWRVGSTCYSVAVHLLRWSPHSSERTGRFNVVKFDC
jgi:hypothetical protein